MFNKISALLAIWLLALSACGNATTSSDTDAGNDDECTCDSEIPYTVSNCTPQENGDCIDAGSHMGTDPHAVFDLICPTLPQQSCTGNVYTVTCEGKTSTFRIVSVTTDAGASQCGFESE